MTLLDGNQREAVLGEDTFELLASIESSFGIELGLYEDILEKLSGS